MKGNTTIGFLPVLTVIAIVLVLIVEKGGVLWH